MLLTVKDDKRAEAYESNLCWMVQNPCVKKKRTCSKKAANESPGLSEVRDLVFPA